VLKIHGVDFTRLNDKGTNNNGCMKNKDDNDKSLLIITKSNKVGVTFSKIIKYLIMKVEVW